MEVRVGARTQPLVKTITIRNYPYDYALYLFGATLFYGVAPMNSP